MEDFMKNSLIKINGLFIRQTKILEIIISMNP